jgi:hypothetical protein
MSGRMKTSLPIDAPGWTRAPLLPMLLLLVALLARAQTFGNPVIEFDEQYYRLIGERMLDGAVPYLDIWDRKPVGLFLLYALAALVGGLGPLPYQLMATLFVAGTAWAIHAMARRLARGWRGPLLAAILYIFWLNLLQGEGGQASVLHALPICGAALLVQRRLADGRVDGLLRDGALAMLLVGLALQIKYTVLPAGAWFGMALLWAGRRQGLGLARLLGLGALGALVAALPTLAAWSAYGAMGAGKAWLFANLTSILLREAMPAADMLSDLAGGLAVMALPLLLAAGGWRLLGPRGAAAAFALGWALVELVAIVAMRSFVPHYWVPLLPPLLLLAAPLLDLRPRLALGVAALGALAGQAMVGIFIHGKGDQRTVDHIVAAIGPAPNCISVFDGFPALYQATRACLPSPYLFPSLLNGAMEARALPVDPVAEVERIMAARPDAVVLDEPRWSLRNLATNAVVDRELAAHYRLVLREETGNGRFRLVYRVKAQDGRP